MSGSGNITPIPWIGLQQILSTAVVTDHMLHIFNTLTRRKDLFSPLTPGEVRLYVCGMTVYDYCHLGHARMMVAFDVVQRWLRALGYKVIYVRNITDIDDKIIKRAVQNGETISALTERFIQAMHEDTDALGVQRPDHEPRATRYVAQMQGIITRLQQNGLAYQSPDGDVNYAVRKFSAYGKLSGKSVDELRAGERIAVDSGKQDPLDFVLWKSAKSDEPQEVKWESPWGPGRPGWHIECSAMSCSLLGETFDIHGGGMDLQFPHHENEIAQSEGATGKPFVRFWMHNGFVNIDSEKMSKSLGNFFTIRDVLKQWDPEIVRFLLVRTHYRSPLNYSDQHLSDAKNALSRLYTALKETGPDEQTLDWDEPHAVRVRTAMNDDFNTPVVISVLFELAAEVNRTHDPALARQLKGLANLLGFLNREPRVFLQAGVDQGGLTLEQINALIAARQAAKAGKNYPEADRLRAELTSAGIVVEDSPQGTTWRRV